MSVGISRNTRVLIQGITGREGSLHTRLCIEYGTRVVAGVTPGKEGSVSNGVPVWNSVSKARNETGADFSLIFVPPLYAADAILESVFAGIETIVCITEGIPVHDMMKIKRVLTTHKTTLIGPNCPGIITPGQAKAGIMPGAVFKQGNMGVLSRSGTLLYEASHQIVRSGKGVSTAVGIGGDPIIGSDFCFWLGRFEADPQTESVMIIGEIGGDLEERVADYIGSGRFSKPLFAFIAGRSAPEGKRMGHAGAISSGGRGLYNSKVNALKKAGVHIIADLAQIRSVMVSF
jgi:succinyl-CoA synthetase alpha subunit